MRIKPLFMVTAVLEVSTGLALLVSPALVASILIGAPFDTPADSIVGRVAGAALLALGLARGWAAHADGDLVPRARPDETRVTDPLLRSQI
jgi:hypothetical protein